MSLKKERQLNHYFLGVGSKDIPEEVTGSGRKEEKCSRPASWFRGGVAAL